MHETVWYLRTLNLSDRFFILRQQFKLQDETHRDTSSKLTRWTCPREIRNEAELFTS